MILGFGVKEESAICGSAGIDFDLDDNESQQESNLKVSLEIV
ncbi:MAG: hypothetical protein R6V56_02860 [Lentisphaeria bacterium]